MSSSRRCTASARALTVLLVPATSIALTAGCADPPPLRPAGDIHATSHADAGAGSSGGYGGPGGSGGSGTDAGVDAPDSAPPPGSPLFEPTTSHAPSPPPISGGTLIVSRDDTRVIVADPDRDAVYVADLVARKLVAEIGLRAGDEPGRLVEDGAHRVHVALRGSGDVVTVDLATNTVVARRHVCGAPRGIAWERALDRLHVACAEGVVVTLAADPEDPVAGDGPLRIVQLEPDLRDVVVVGDGLAVSRFRSAEVLFLDAKGALVDRERPLPWSDFSGGFAPHVAWKTIARPGSPDVVVVHQRERTAAIVEGPKYYGDRDSCGGSVVHTTLSVLQKGAAPSQVPPRLPGAIVPVDLAASIDGAHYAVIAAGNAHLVHPPPTAYDATPYPLIVVSSSALGADGCAATEKWAAQPTGEPTSVAFDGSGEAVVFSREPASIQILGRNGDRSELRIGQPSVLDSGHEVFHASSGGNIACASCHPEGGDDGHVWNLGGSLLRTQPLAGALATTAPYHWEGSMPTLEELIRKTWVDRMNGLPLADDRVSATKTWLLGLSPRPLGTPDPSLTASIDHGKVLFESPAVGCSSCHSGPLFTDSRTLDVGTGGAFQVPSLLRVGDRAPFLHGGCATTLRDVLTGCGVADRHGKTSTLSDGDLADVIAYLRSL